MRVIICAHLQSLRSKNCMSPSTERNKLEMSYAGACSSFWGNKKILKHLEFEDDLGTWDNSVHLLASTLLLTAQMVKSHWCLRCCSMLSAANKDSRLSAHTLCFKASLLLRLQTFKSASFLLLFYSLRICWLERHRDLLLRAGARTGGWHNIMMSEERNNYSKTEGDANWVIKDFNLKGCGKVISAVRDDRRVYLQRKTDIVQAQTGI